MLEIGNIFLYFRDLLFEVVGFDVVRSASKDVNFVVFFGIDCLVEASSLDHVLAVPDSSVVEIYFANTAFLSAAGSSPEEIDGGGATWTG